jgi:hypothetical protein
VRNDWTRTGFLLLATAAPVAGDERSPAIRVHVEVWERAGEGVGESVRDVKQVLLEGSKAPRLVDSLLSEADLLVVVQERTRGIPPSSGRSDLAGLLNVYTVTASIIDARRSPQRILGQGLMWRQAAGDLIVKVDRLAREQEHALLRRRPDWPALGFQFEPLTKDLERELGAKDGDVVVTEVAAGSPAAAGGLQGGDSVLKIDGRKVESAGELARMLYTAPPGSTVRLELSQKGARRTATLRLP